MMAGRGLKIFTCELSQQAQSFPSRLTQACKAGQGRAKDGGFQMFDNLCKDNKDLLPQVSALVPESCHPDLQ